MEFLQKKLDNGLTLIAETNPGAASMAVGFFVKTGSRDETPEVSGVSHFLEHMVFKGTVRRSPFDVNRDFDRMGANYNAFTSEENTVFYGAVLPEFQEPLLDLLCDMLRPALRREDFDVEKNVIVGEIAVYEDQPRFRIYDRLMARHFSPHPLGNSILGTKQSVSGLLLDQMRSYFDQRYSPGNIVVVGVGNVDFAALAEKVAKTCCDWQPRDVSRQMPEVCVSQKTEVIQDRKVTREHIGMMSPAPSRQSSERFAAELLATIVGDSTGSRLFYALVEPAIADEASVAYAPLDGAGAFMTFVSAETHRASEALGIANKELKKLLDDGIEEDELLAAKNKIATGATLKGELPMGRLAAVGLDWIYRREYRPLAEQIEMLFAVTQDQVHQLARQYDLAMTTVVALGPMGSL